MEDKLVLRKALKKFGFPEQIVRKPKVMAGRKTIPSVMEEIENYADSIVPDKYARSHPYKELLNYEDLMLEFEGQQSHNSWKKLKSYILAFDIINHIFVNNYGAEPKDFNPIDLYT